MSDQAQREKSRRQAFEARLARALARGQALGNLRRKAEMENWVEICGQLEAHEILTMVPRVLTGLARNPDMRPLLESCGLPIDNNLFYDGIGATVASYSRRDRSAPERVAADRRLAELQEQFNNLVQASLDLEAERGRQEQHIRALEQELAALRAALTQSWQHYTAVLEEESARGHNDPKALPVERANAALSALSDLMRAAGIEPPQAAPSAAQQKIAVE
ncbi:hypothetical protein [Telmatospirillum sp. J64-1]|uniref:hypothetical protein n=1 Tax=Telmatospirillum sp. J64-1 TaxID=2502183 RepID=UPI00115F4C4A|nr:hypothetical protein [Telmatospirillum sp. J64-1]